jgi:hypothetical protein
MYTVHKSALFMRQWQAYAQNYKDRAGIQSAERFIAAVEGFFFRLEETQIFVDLIYAQRMDIAHRFIVDTFDP